LPFDTVHPVGDYTFRRVPSDSKPEDLEIHQLKYPTVGAKKDLNVIFPIERLQELEAEKIIGELAPNFYSFIGYNMDALKLEQTLAEDIADAVEAEKPMRRCLRPPDRFAIRASRWFSAPLNEEEFRRFQSPSLWM
jgi:hypothetical protein